MAEAQAHLHIPPCETLNCKFAIIAKKESCGHPERSAFQRPGSPATGLRRWGGAEPRDLHLFLKR
jgi:hypothetical protein